MNTTPKIGPVTEPQVERAFGMWSVRLPDRETKVNGQKAYVRNHLSTDGKSIRMFHSKEQAKAWLVYYKELLAAREEFMKTQEEGKAKAIEGETAENNQKDHGNE